ncbi:hypothetical protein K2173_012243 [Erythroxylum novogranatense]|uniref:DUF1771 domain-containing protein n=1 Tax=Erythroxylum novogranatense TaxID=1862640 RepID=A0AAV8SBU4_9ROSI|nr:hypothetical protein K2173_012243 [Erythroxylum novogranatense]
MCKTLDKSLHKVEVVLLIPICQCDYSVEKDISVRQLTKSFRLLLAAETKEVLADGFSEYTSQTSDNEEARDSKRDHGHKSFGQAFSKCKAPSSSSLQRNESDLFQNSELRSSILKKQTRSQRVDTDGSYSSVNSKEYKLLRAPARQHWKLMQSYKKRAAQAYSRGKHMDAARLSKLADVERNLARAADDKASQEIFKARNKNTEN